MKIALYGLPCSGKTTLLSNLNDIEVVHGRKELDKISKGAFSKLSPQEKTDMRIAYTKYINGITSKHIISDGHYSFVEDVVFTKEDGDVYDVFLYLYCSPKNIMNRVYNSDKNKRYATLSLKTIEKWQNFEIESLRAECHKRNKEFYVISDAELDSCKFAEFIHLIMSGYNTYNAAKEIARKIMGIYPTPSKVHIVDGDKTIIKQDSFKFCCNGKTKVYDGNFYTGYQSFLFDKEISSTFSNENLVEDIEINQFLYEKIRKEQYIILSAGIADLWNKIGQTKGLRNIIASHFISADTKYYVIKILMEHGYSVTSYGDSKIDIYMLRNANEGYLYINERLSSSLQDENLNGVKLLYDVELYNLEANARENTLRNIEICKSNSGINGANLASAHFKLGQELGSVMFRKIPSVDTAIVVLERGGRFFGDGIYCEFGGKFYSYNPSIEKMPTINEERVIIVDSVINTGKSIMEIINTLKAINEEVDVFIASNVIQSKAVKLFDEYKIFTVRVSENSFVGQNQATQTGKTGPDTADRLYNQIKSLF